MIVRTRRLLRVPGTPLGPHGFTAGRLPRHGPLHGLLRAPRRLGLPGGISHRVLRAGRAVRAGHVLALLVHGSRAEVPPASAHASRRPCLCARLHVVRVRSNVCSLSTSAYCLCSTVPGPCPRSCRVLPPARSSCSAPASSCCCRRETWAASFAFVCTACCGVRGRRASAGLGFRAPGELWLRPVPGG